MDTSMKFIFGLAVAVILSMMGYAIVMTNNSGSLGGGFSLDQAYYLSAGSGTAALGGNPGATTTVLYLATSNTATSSITGFTGQATNIDLYLSATASSTSAKLQYFVSFSPNKIDWYKEDCSTVSSNILITHGASACVHEWTPGVTATTTKNITIGATQAKYFKVDFGVTTANMALWSMAVPRDENPN